MLKGVLYTSVDTCRHARTAEHETHTICRARTVCHAYTAYAHTCTRTGQKRPICMEKETYLYGMQRMRTHTRARLAWRAGRASVHETEEEEGVYTSVHTRSRSQIASQDLWRRGTG